MENVCTISAVGECTCLNYETTKKLWSIGEDFEPSSASRYHERRSTGVKDGRNFQSVQNSESIPTHSTFAARYVVEAKQVSGDYVYN
jgi:hypothetical protein